MIAPYRTINIKNNISIEAEYNTLRNEILHEMAMQTNLRIAMSTLSITILAFGMERNSAILCLIAFAIIIPFRLLIISEQFAILRLSAYIIVRFEKNNTQLKLESTIADMKNTDVKLAFLSRTIAGAGYYIASILGLIAVCSYISCLDTFTLVNTSCAVICFLIIVLLDAAFNFNETYRNSYKQEFENLLNK